MKEKILGYIASLLLLLLRKTWRFHIYFQDDQDKDFFLKAIFNRTVDPDLRFLLSFFHQDEISLVPFFKKIPLCLLISTSKDGEIMSQVAQRFGYYPVRGSSSKKAVSGLLAAIKMVKQGYGFATAVDGPRGPIYKVKDGIPLICKKTQVPILPVRVYPDRFKMFEKSWNKAKFPLPFSRIDMIVGKIQIYDKESLEACLLGLKPEMIQDKTRPVIL